MSAEQVTSVDLYLLGIEVEEEFVDIGNKGLEILEYDQGWSLCSYHFLK